MRTARDATRRRHRLAAIALVLSGLLCATVPVPPGTAVTPGLAAQADLEQASRPSGSLWPYSLLVRHRVADGWTAHAQPPREGLGPMAWQAVDARRDPAAPGDLGGRMSPPEPEPRLPAGDDPGIPDVALAAYQRAAARSDEVAAGCDVRWTVLAGIGRIESNHGRTWGPETTLSPSGDVTPRILGPRLDGTGGTAAIRDTDGGRLDGDPVWDRAVGPMQFIPSSWERFGRDGSGDGRADPNNFFDAALSAVAHLCLATPGNYDDRGDLARALLGYNRSATYVATVLAWIDAYEGVGRVPDLRVAQAGPPAGSTPGEGGTGAVMQAPTSSGAGDTGPQVTTRTASADDRAPGGQTPRRDDDSSSGPSGGSGHGDPRGSGDRDERRGGGERNGDGPGASPDGDEHAEGSDTSPGGDTDTDGDGDTDGGDSGDADEDGSDRDADVEPGDPRHPGHGAQDPDQSDDEARNPKHPEQDGKPDDASDGEPADERDEKPADDRDEKPADDEDGKPADGPDGSEEPGDGSDVPEPWGPQERAVWLEEFLSALHAGDLVAVEQHLDAELVWHVSPAPEHDTAGDPDEVEARDRAALLDELGQRLAAGQRFEPDPDDDPEADAGTALRLRVSRQDEDDETPDEDQEPADDDRQRAALVVDPGTGLVVEWWMAALDDR